MIVVAFGGFGRFWLTLAVFSRFCSILAVLADFGCFWPILAVFGRLWPFLVDFGRFWPSLAVFGPLLVDFGSTCFSLLSLGAASKTKAIQKHKKDFLTKLYFSPKPYMLFLLSTSKPFLFFLPL